MERDNISSKDFLAIHTISSRFILTYILYHVTGFISQFLNTLHVYIHIKL